MIQIKTAGTIMILLILSVAGFSCSNGGTPEISITNASFMPSQMMIGRASSFMQITNSGRGSDTLKGCSIKEHPSVRGELHDVIDGKMTRIDHIKIPADKNTDLMRGGYHLMFFGIPENLAGNVTLILNFEKSGPIEVTAQIDTMAGHMNH